MSARRPALLTLRNLPPRPTGTNTAISSPTSLRILLNLTSPLPHNRHHIPPPLDLQPPTPPPKQPRRDDMFIVSPRTPNTPGTPMGSHHLRSPRASTTQAASIRASLRSRREKVKTVAPLKSPIAAALAGLVNSPTHVPVAKTNAVEGVAGFSYIQAGGEKKEGVTISRPVVRPVNNSPLLREDPRSPRVVGAGLGGCAMELKGPETPFLRPPPSPWANAMI